MSATTEIESTPLHESMSWLDRVRNFFSRKYRLALVLGLVVAVIIGAVVFESFQRPLLGNFYPATGSTVLAQGQGSGSKVIYASTFYIKLGKLEKYLPTPKVSIMASCYGNRQWLHIKAEPGNESLQPMCYPTGGGAAILDGPYKFPYPRRVIITAPADVHWKFMFVEPGNANFGIAQTG